MKNQVIINHSTHTISISKTFEKKASVYKSDEYNKLVAIKNDFPTFKIEVVAPAKRNSRMSKITLDDMRRYISSHDNKKKSLMAEFDKMCEKKKDSSELVTKTFFEIKKWFFEQFPDLKQNKNNKEVA